MQRHLLADNDFIEVNIADWQAARDQGQSVFERVDLCIGKLPTNFKTAVRTFYFEERTDEEAADVLSLSPSNLRKRLERARALLHDCLSSQINTAPAAQLQADGDYQGAIDRFRAAISLLPEAPMTETRNAGESLPGAVLRRKQRARQAACRRRPLPRKHLSG